MASILQVERVSKRYGTKILFEELSLNINEGEKVALIAPNGVGKSSLLKIIAGVESSDTNNNGEKGSVMLFGDKLIAFLEQEPTLNKGITILEESAASVPSAEYWERETKAKQILSQLGLNDSSKKTETLSGGEKKRVAIAKALLTGATFLILDEPTNHLDIDAIEYLEEILKRSRITLLMVTHDRYFLDRVCNRIIELEGGALYNYEGNYSYYLEKREERILNAETESKRAKNLFRKELEWMRRMPQARGTKAKYRIDAFYDLKERAQSVASNSTITIDTAVARLGRKLINCHSVSHNWGSIRTIKEFSYNFARGEKIGLVGANGVGKSTFLEVITGNIAPTSGHIEHGETVIFGHYRQGGIEFDANDKVIDAVRKFAEVVTLSDGSTMEVERFLTRFMFPHSMHNTPISQLSGGEKRRLYLVTILMQSPNFLILDEPTNDLDLATINILEEYLIEFSGSLIIVSHDRFFLDKVAQHLFVMEGDGLIRGYSGSYSEYRESVKEQERVAKQRENSAKESREKKREPKLSYKERRELEEIESKLDKLQKEKSTLEDALNSGLLALDELVEKSNRYSSLENEIDSLEERWLELSDIEN